MLPNAGQQPVVPRQIIRQTINHLPTDRIPKGELLIEDAVVSQVLGSPTVGFADRLMCCRHLEQDLICLQPEYGSPAQALPAAEMVNWPDLKDWVEKSNLFTFAMLDGPIGWGTKIYGYSEFLILSRRSPLEFAGLIEAVTRLNTALAGKLIDQGIDGILLADDMAFQRGLLFNQKVIREQMFPAAAGIIALGRQAGIPVFMHSDGNLSAIMADIVEAGFNGLHCLDKNAGMYPLELQRLFGKDLCFWGGLAVEDLEQAKDDQYRQQLVSEVRQLHANRGFILGTNSGLFAGINVQNLMEIIETISNVD